MNEPGTTLPPLGEDKYTSLAEEARLDLARKISGLLPTLDDTAQEQVRHYVFGMLRLIAKDQTARVRKLLAEELKCAPNAPQDVIHTLAWDKDLSIARPVIEFSPMLDEAMLLDLIANSGIEGVLDAIARRHELPGKVGEAIVETGNEQAIGTLLENKSTELSPNALQRVLEIAPAHNAWHRVLLGRDDITLRTVNRIAGFISTGMIEELQSKHELSRKTGESLAAAASLRLTHPHIEREIEAELLAGELFRKGRLSPEHVMQAIHEDYREFATTALSLLSDITRENVERMLNVKNAGVATSLAFKAGLTMRDTIILQLQLARIPHTEILQAKDGIDYPLSEQEMNGYLEMFTD